MPRPLEGFLDAVGRAAEAVVRPVLDFLGDVFPGPDFVGWTVFGGIVVGAALAFAALLSKRRGVGLAEAVRSWAERGIEDPGGVEARAVEAERRGDHAAAVRLRFRAGLLRLDRAGAIEWRESITSREVSRAVRSPAFDGVAAAFDQIVYGKRPADAADSEGARRGWQEVLAGMKTS